MCRRCRLGCSHSVSRAEKYTLHSRFWRKSRGIPRRKPGLESSLKLRILATWAFSPREFPRPWATPRIEALLLGYLGFCAQFFLSTCIFFGKPVAHARHSPPPRRVIHAIVNGKDQLVATRAARGPQAKLRSARFTGETPQPVALHASACASQSPQRRRVLRGARARPRRRFVAERTREPQAPWPLRCHARKETSYMKSIP